MEESGGKNGEGSHSWYPNVVHSPHGTGVWKGILKGWDLFKNRISFVIGTGDSDRFWKDKWCGDLKLSRAFLMLFSFAVDKEEMVSAVLRMREDVVTWSPCFRRQPHDWELDSIGSYLSNYMLKKFILMGQIVLCGRVLRAANFLLKLTTRFLRTT